MDRAPARGGAARQVSDFGAHPSWSPDGRRLVFHSEALLNFNPGGAFSSTSTIWTVAVDGRAKPAPITQRGQPSGSHGMPAWWPDGRHVVFAVNSQVGRGSRPALWTVDADSGALYELSAHAKVTPEFAVSGWSRPPLQRQTHPRHLVAADFGSAKAGGRPAPDRSAGDGLVARSHYGLALT